MNHDRYDDDYIRTILLQAHMIALVGASAKTERPSNGVLKYLLDHRYIVHPINPGLTGKKLYGQIVYESLSGVPDQIDMVDIFRNSQAAMEITRTAIDAKAKIIWMQLGVRNDEAAELAEEAGLKVIMNRCPKIEIARLKIEGPSRV